MSAANLLNSHVKNHSTYPSAKRKCPWTHLGRSNNFLFGSVIITSHKKIRRAMLDPCTNPSLQKDCRAVAQGTGTKSIRICRQPSFAGKFIILLIHKAEETAALSQSRADSVGITEVKIVKIASVFFLQQNKYDSDTCCLISEEKGSFLHSRPADLHLSNSVMWALVFKAVVLVVLDAQPQNLRATREIWNGTSQQRACQAQRCCK